ncbi:uncharacterized protein GGS22DRAFT_199788 [Annulohypoxylon maeteangense]|uniref:uncharacterized protein n=1 Tax=Annulohypoxylon maeteangense TaxID=1927788 RepID=UPI0020074FC4|nr:uncharacterized protein GGS22DRAFT_199788 [Annulohypoxylon maeteangense]KAI0885484.1 hypothetical protein GGS22DRAFT_199788 [Annulohypoxylon maeteangense]
MYLLHALGVIVLQLILTTGADHGGLNTQMERVNLAGDLTIKSESIVGLRRKMILPDKKHRKKSMTTGASPCTGDSKKPIYQISGFQFNKTTIEAGERGMTHFQLDDVVNKATIPCTTPFLQDTDEPVWNECDGDFDVASPKTTFQYTPSSRELEVNQMWVCETENRTHPRPYFSSATIDLTELLECIEDEKQTRCTVADELVSPFTGKYITPIWTSGSMEIIPPSEKEAPGTPWNPTPCIGPSFSYPNWDVEDFAYEGANDESSVSFRLNNHGNNQSTKCTVPEGEWASCDNSTNVRFTEDTGKLSIRQSWVCNGGDRYSENVTFKAVGSASIDNRSSNSTYIRGSLIEPIELTPNVAPEGVNHPGCIETSETPSWIVTSLVWNEKWRDGYNSGNLTATFRNPANGFSLSCTGDGEELNRDGRYGNERWWGCALATSPFSNYRVDTLIKLNPLTEVFSIDQRWYCNGHDSKLPAKLKAVGNVNTTLECSWTNETWAKSFIKTCYQTELPLEVQGSVMEKTELPENIFFEMAPSGYSCTIASVLSTQWRAEWMSDSLYTSPTFANNFETTDRFDITFVALDGFQGVRYKDISLTPFMRTSEPGRWHDCKNYETGEETSNVWASHSLECKWQLDLATGYFAINHTWFCDDKDPEYPIIFKGSGSRFFDFSCYIDRRSDEISCNPTGLNVAPVLPTYLSWRSIPAAELRT